MQETKKKIISAVFLNEQKELELLLEQHAVNEDMLTIIWDKGFNSSPCRVGLYQITLCLEYILNSLGSRNLFVSSQLSKLEKTKKIWLENFHTEFIDVDFSKLLSVIEDENTYYFRTEEDFVSEFQLLNEILRYNSNAMIDLLKQGVRPSFRIESKCTDIETFVQLLHVKDFKIVIEAISKHKIKDIKQLLTSLFIISCLFKTMNEMYIYLDTPENVRYKLFKDFVGRSRERSMKD